MSYWTWVTVSDLFILSLPFLNRSSPALHVPSSVNASCNLHEAFSEGYLMYVRFWALTKQPHSDVKYQATTTTYKGWKAPVVGYKTPSKHREQTRRIYFLWRLFLSLEWAATTIPSILLLMSKWKEYGWESSGGKIVRLTWPVRVKPVSW